jgi:hypothetical protein
MQGIDGHWAMQIEKLLRVLVINLHALLTPQQLVISSAYIAKIHYFGV